MNSIIKPGLDGRVLRSGARTALLGYSVGYGPNAGIRGTENAFLEIIIIVG